MSNGLSEGLSETLSESLNEALSERRLVEPDFAFHLSFVEAVREAEADNRTRAGAGMSPWGLAYSELRAEELADPDRFRRYLAELAEAALPGRRRPPGIVPATTRWFVDGEEFLGRVSIRHQLTPLLLQVGGHIGYDVRPSARGQGHATEMLRAALPIANSLGIDPVLVTCHVGNLASRRVIEKCGGVLEDVRSDRMRFWFAAPAR